MGNSKEEYLAGIIAEINTTKERGKNAIYRCNAKIPDEWAEFAKNYFTTQTLYRSEFRKCETCKGTWDILIFF